MGMIDFQNGLLLGLSTKGKTIKKTISASIGVLSLETKKLPFIEVLPKEKIDMFINMGVFPKAADLIIAHPSANHTQKIEINSRIVVEEEK